MSSSFDNKNHGDSEYKIFENRHNRKISWNEALTHALFRLGSSIEKHIDKIRVWFVALWILATVALSLHKNWFYPFYYQIDDNIEGFESKNKAFESILVDNTTDTISPSLDQNSDPFATFGWRFSHLYVQLANLWFVVSNIQMDILYLRIFLISASIFFFLWGGLVLSTALDVVLYASINIVVNI